jgi:hypothetical protein
MIIWVALYLFGLVAIPTGLVHIVLGLKRKEKKRVILGAVVPVFIWICIFALYESDRRFIEDERQQNGGQMPDNVW